MAFRHLSSKDISDIVRSHQAGETMNQIAIRYGVHHTTVMYHVRKSDNLSGGHVYSVVHLEPKPCIHPSLKCLVCGMAIDELRRAERSLIRELQSALALAEDRLRAHGLSVE